MRTIRTMLTAVIATTIASSAMSALAAWPAKFRWDNVDGKCYVTPVKTQTGSTDRSYAYAVMDCQSRISGKHRFPLAVTAGVCYTCRRDASIVFLQLCGFSQVGWLGPQTPRKGSL